MKKVAILDDYQNVSMEYIKLSKIYSKCKFVVFNEPFIDEKDAIYYTSTIKGFGLDTTYHFFMIIRNGEKAYEIEDIKGEQFDQWAGDQMYELVSATKINPN